MKLDVEANSSSVRVFVVFLVLFKKISFDFIRFLLFTHLEMGLTSPRQIHGPLYHTICHKRTLLKICVVFIVLLVALLYVIDFSSATLSNIKFILPLRDTCSEAATWDWKFIDELDQSTHQLHKSYFVNTKGCRMPSFNVIDENVKKFVIDEQPVHCGTPLTQSNENSIWIDLNETEIQATYNVGNVDSLYCEYEPFKRQTDFQNEFPDTEKVQFRLGDVIKITDEFIRVICHAAKDGEDSEIYRDYHFFVPNKPTTNGNEVNGDNGGDTSTVYSKPVSQHSEQSNRLNVVIVGLDSISRLNFHRRMNASVDVLLNELNAIEFFGFNKVADNTYPNLIPTLTGLDENELVTACMPTKNHTFDLCRFIWDEFKDKNYTTAYIEDMAGLSLFHYLRNGFKSQPTDYNSRPLIYEMEMAIANKKSGNTFMCLGKRRTFDILLEYADKFLAQMTASKRDFFSFFWSTSYTHDFLNYPQLIDGDLAKFLRSDRVASLLDNTFLVLMSDHGLRWGSFRSTYQGMMEERQPFLFFVPPKWFPHKYPEAMRNLLRNRHKLVSHFDLYETLYNLVSLDTLEVDRLRSRALELAATEIMPRGISMFLPISDQRTCSDASIPAHFCTCHEKVELSTTDPRVSKVAHYIVSQMNELIRSKRECHRLRLNSVLSAHVDTSSAAFKVASNQFEDITVRVQTRPGFGEFEATVRSHGNDLLELAGTISRTNLYGKQSYCIDDYNLKLYCFCDSRM